MIAFKLSTYNEKEDLNNWTQMHCAYELSVSEYAYVALEQGNCLGVCIFEYKEGALEEACIKGIYIDPDQRRFKIGDGLIRSTLHYLERQSVKNVTLLTNPLVEPFYIYEQFEKVDAQTYQVTLPDFFLRPCKGSQK